MRGNDKRQFYIGVALATILAAGLTGTVGKVYDGTTVATQIAPANYTLSGVVNGDNVALNNPTTGIYASKNVGTGIGVSVTGLALTGSTAGNYLLASNSVSGNIGTISPATLTAGLTGIVRKQFDGTTLATMAPSNYTLSGIVAGDSVILDAPATGRYATPDPGTGIPVSVSGLAISGPGSGNYLLASTMATGNIGEIFLLPPPPPTLEFINSQPQPAAEYDALTFHLLFGGGVPCIPSKDDNTQQVICMPLLAGFGVSSAN